MHVLEEKVLYNNYYKFKRFVFLKKRIHIYIYIQALKRSTRISILNSKGLILLTLSVGFLNFKKSQRKGSFVARRLFRFLFKK